jgi:hypothetical protein
MDGNAYHVVVGDGEAMRSVSTWTVRSHFGSSHFGSGLANLCGSLAFCGGRARGGAAIAAAAEPRFRWWLHWWSLEALVRGSWYLVSGRA